MTDDVQKHSVHTLVFRSLKRTHDMFASEQGTMPPVDDHAEQLKVSVKAHDQYGPVLHMPVAEPKVQRVVAAHPVQEAMEIHEMKSAEVNVSEDFSYEPKLRKSDNPSSKALSVVPSPQEQARSLYPNKAPSMPKPKWHPPWKLYRVISGHLGWVRCLAFDPTNEWFCTGSADRTIKIWDLASATLKLSLTGHISTVRGVIVSQRQPYLFSCGEDKQVLCWDLEQNKTIRHYHGHLSGVYAIDLHPTIDILVTCGRDATARVWDMRTKACVHTLSGHTNTVADVKCQALEPQVITGSHDCTIRLWDLAAGKCRVTLTNHKKSVRSLVFHPNLYTFASASPDNIKQWKCPDGNFLQNLSGHNAILNSIAVNSDGVLVSAADNGSMYYWDWRTGYNFQRSQAAVQPGSLDSEAGVYACQFDRSGSRLITAEADKTLKVYREDDSATEESHPINWRPSIIPKKGF